MSNPTMSANEMNTHSNAFDSVQPGMKAAIQKALDAGVPWLTIMTWIIANGPAFIQKVADLIKLFQPTPPAPPVV